MSVNDVTPVHDPSWPERVEIYDTTLRDGSQLEGISLTVDDKLRIAEQLDWLGVDYIEAGYPGANPKDDELFRRAPAELKLETSTLVAFGSTRRGERHPSRPIAPSPPLRRGCRFPPHLARAVDSHLIHGRLWDSPHGWRCCWSPKCWGNSKGF
jgi:hypothetical protein